MDKLRDYTKPMKKGRIRVIICYRSTGAVVAWDGVFNPDRNSEEIKRILVRKPASSSVTANQNIKTSPEKQVEF